MPETATAFFTYMFSAKPERKDRTYAIIGAAYSFVAKLNRSRQIAHRIEYDLEIKTESFSDGEDIIFLKISSTHIWFKSYTWLSGFNESVMRLLEQQLSEDDKAFLKKKRSGNGAHGPLESQLSKDQAAAKRNFSF